MNTMPLRLQKREVVMIEKCNECGMMLPHKSEYECEKCEEVFCSDCTVIRCVGRSIYHRVICKICDGQNMKINLTKELYVFFVMGKIW